MIPSWESRVEYGLHRIEKLEERVTALEKQTMTADPKREYAKKLLPIIEAYANGEQIEAYNWLIKKWVPADLYLYECVREEYRIKPKEDSHEP